MPTRMTKDVKADVMPTRMTKVYGYLNLLSSVAYPKRNREDMHICKSRCDAHTYDKIVRILESFGLRGLSCECVTKLAVLWEIMFRKY